MRSGRAWPGDKSASGSGGGAIHSFSGVPDENLDPAFRATGRDVNGGYAEYMTVPAAYAHPIPETFADAEAALLLCVGAVGYRALRLARIEDGQRMGFTGLRRLGASGPPACTASLPAKPILRLRLRRRRAQLRARARRELGASWVGDTAERAPEPLHAIIDTTPAWKPVV